MIKEEQSKRGSDNSNLLLTGGAIACWLVIPADVLGAEFGTGAPIIKDDDNNDVAPVVMTSAPVASPTASPVVVEVTRPADFQSLISSSSFNLDALGDTESPEALALSWLISDSFILSGKSFGQQCFGLC
jgi:hypothetical protein